MREQRTAGCHGELGRDVGRRRERRLLIHNLDRQARRYCQHIGLGAEIDIRVLTFVGQGPK